jgi:hypothetical protein
MILEGVRRRKERRKRVRYLPGWYHLYFDDSQNLLA